MKAILSWCIHDPAYAHMAGLRTSGRFGCPVCCEDTEALRLKCCRNLCTLVIEDFWEIRLTLIIVKKPNSMDLRTYRGAPSRLTGVVLFDRTTIADKDFGKLVRRSPVETLYSKRSILFSLHIIGR